MNLESTQNLGNGCAIPAENQPTDNLPCGDLPTSDLPAENPPAIPQPQADADNTPSTIPINFAQIEQSFAEYLDKKIWIPYRLEVTQKEDGGIKLGKIPTNGINPKNPAIGNDARWIADKSVRMTYHEARAYYEANKGNPAICGGIGIIFVEDGDLVAFDLDDCVLDGEISEPARTFLHGLPIVTYAEFSPSGKGLHIVVTAKIDTSITYVKGKLEDGLKVEVFCHKRFMTLTGQCIRENQNTEIHFQQPFVEMILAELEREKNRKSPNTPSANSATIAIERGEFDFDEKNLPTYNAMLGRFLHDTHRKESTIRAVDLYKNANWEDYSDFYPSSSEARFAVLMQLVYWLDRNPSYIKKAYLNSPIYQLRDKYSIVKTEIQNAINENIAENKGCISEYDNKNKSKYGNWRPIYHYMKRRQKGMGEYITKIYKEKFLYDHDIESWFMFYELFWNISKGDYIGNIAQDELEKVIYYIINNIEIELRKEKDTEKKGELENKKEKMLKALHNIQGTDYSAKVITNVKKNGNLGCVDLNWDSQSSNIIPASNGIIDLKTGTLRPGTPQDRLLKRTKVKYDPDADCPLWKQTLNEIFQDNQELIDCFHKLIGYTACRNPTKQLFIFLTGGGSNGKDVIIKTLDRVFGDLSENFARGIILDNKFEDPDRPRPELAKLRGVAFAHFSELKENARIDAAMFKALSGGSLISVRNLYSKETMKFPSKATFFLMTNHLPRIDAMDFALWRRIKVIPFKVRFVKNPNPDNPNERPIDDTREQNLESEDAGILNWIVQGAVKYHAEGLDFPACVEEAGMEYQEDMDTLKDFLDATIKPGNDPITDFLPSKRLYEKYLEWADSNGIKVPMSHTMLGTELRKRGIKKDKIGGIMHYIGYVFK